MPYVEATIEALLSEKRVFEPPPGFAARALVADRSIYERAERDFEAFWAEESERLSWHRKWGPGPRGEPAVGEVVRGAKLNTSAVPSWTRGGEPRPG
jgi:acetyl-CoA synthetase